MIYSHKKVEELVENRLFDFESKFGKIKKLPIPVDRIIENVFDLYILWDEIPEENGEVILGGLIPHKKQIILNTKQRKLFEDKPGLERSTKGHELGHWDLYTQKDLINQPTFSFASETNFIMRRSRANDDLIKILIANMWKSGEAHKQVIDFERKKDSPLVKSMVDKYASVLSMPKRFIKTVCADFNLLNWKNLYEIARIFDVSISALTVRLQQMNLIYIDSNKKLYLSKEDFIGQTRLSF